MISVHCVADEKHVSSGGESSGKEGAVSGMTEGCMFIIWLCFVWLRWNSCKRKSNFIYTVKYHTFRFIYSKDILDPLIALFSYPFLWVSGSRLQNCAVQQTLHFNLSSKPLKHTANVLMTYGKKPVNHETCSSGEDLINTLDLPPWPNEQKSFPSGDKTGNPLFFGRDKIELCPVIPLEHTETLWFLWFIFKKQKCHFNRFCRRSGRKKLSLGHIHDINFPAFPGIETQLHAT